MPNTAIRQAMMRYARSVPSRHGDKAITNAFGWLEAARNDTPPGRRSVVLGKSSRLHWCSRPAACTPVAVDKQGTPAQEDGKMTPCLNAKESRNPITQTFRPLARRFTNVIASRVLSRNVSGVARRLVVSLA